MAAAPSGNPAKDPHLPALHRAGDLIAPTAPQDSAAPGVDEAALSGLLLKLLHQAGRITTPPPAPTLRPSPPPGPPPPASRKALRPRACRAARADHAVQRPLQDQREGPRASRPPPRGLRLRRPGARPPGELCRHAALAVRRHARRPRGAG